MEDGKCKNCEKRKGKRKVTFEEPLKGPSEEKKIKQKTISEKKEVEEKPIVRAYYHYDDETLSNPRVNLNYWNGQYMSVILNNNNFMANQQILLNQKAEENKNLREELTQIKEELKEYQRLFDEFSYLATACYAGNEIPIIDMKDKDDDDIDLNPIADEQIVDEHNW